MSIQETFPDPPDDLFKWASHGPNETRSRTAMGWMYELYDTMRCGSTYAHGSWGYTVLRTIYSDESDRLWPIALAKLRLWVTKYFIHYGRLTENKPDGTVNFELGRRFVLEVVESKELEALQLPDLAKANQNDIKSLTGIFDAWLRQAVKTDEVQFNRNPRFVDFLIIDEGSLRSLAALPEETIPLAPISMQERRARTTVYGRPYLWLIDSQAVRRYQGIDDMENYNGLMKLKARDIPYAWFQRAPRSEDEYHIFKRSEAPDGSGVWFVGSF
ncbi:hypothetical protein PFICI_03630 [Pestalotiopsis fici W106-1]|uniref:Uncharacterized protein n=1 Tax=Pestalotiopsis fici (strain W106-1 / CGMCC3.15140) TaxID=1229662 RepID=W3XHV5_PESFW|nr:uncharacterized protein PFICI_03630 [Pestalotiopsis fici W106-1]ETS85605.1 hypothetical protein PFICI_03630 [Pestalotiopsis fici W106-1]